MVPDCVQFALHVAGIRGDGNDHVLIRHHDDELAACSIRAKGVMSAPPELKPIALFPIRADLSVTFILIRNLLGGGFLDPLARNELLAVPLSLL